VQSRNPASKPTAAVNALLPYFCYNYSSKAEQLFENFNNIVSNSGFLRFYFVLKKPQIRWLKIQAFILNALRIYTNK